MPKADRIQFQAVRFFDINAAAACDACGHGGPDWTLLIIGSHRIVRCDACMREWAEDSVAFLAAQAERLHEAKALATMRRDEATRAWRG